MTIDHCPNCGAKLEIDLRLRPNRITPRPSPGHFQSTQRTPFKQEATVAEARGNWEKVTPVARLEPRDITTQVYDAVVSFVLVAIGAAVICYALSWPWLIGPVSGFAVACFRYFGGMAATKDLLSTVERWTNTDLDGDGHIGSPQNHRVTVEVLKDGKPWQYEDLPGRPEALQKLALVMVGDKNETLTDRLGKRCGLTQEETRELREVFVKRQWAYWNHPKRRQQGITVRTVGYSVLRDIARTPLPQDDFG